MSIPQVQYIRWSKPSRLIEQLSYILPRWMNLHINIYPEGKCNQTSNKIIVLSI